MLPSFSAKVKKTQSGLIKINSSLVFFRQRLPQRVLYSGFIVGLGLLQLIFIFALLGLILEQCGVIEKLYRRSKTGYDSDSESFVTATDEKTQTESRSPRSLRGRRRKRDSLTSSVMSPSFSERKTNESSGMKYWFSAQNPNESARQMSSRRAATHRKLSPGIGSDGGSIFNFF